MQTLINIKLQGLYEMEQETTVGGDIRKVHIYILKKYLLADNQ